MCNSELYAIIFQQVCNECSHSNVMGADNHVDWNWIIFVFGLSYKEMIQNMVMTKLQIGNYKNMVMNCAR